MFYDDDDDGDSNSDYDDGWIGYRPMYVNISSDLEFGYEKMRIDKIIYVCLVFIFLSV